MILCASLRFSASHLSLPSANASPIPLILSHGTILDDLSVLPDKVNNVIITHAFLGRHLVISASSWSAVFVI